MDIDRLRVNEILNYIERIQNDDSDYTFQVEKSVIAEMDCANNWYKSLNDFQETEDENRIICTLFTITIVLVVTLIVVLVIINENDFF